jgi:serine phosphatase RsbU (regulator of sigma subunit)
MLVLFIIKKISSLKRTLKYSLVCFTFCICHDRALGQLTATGDDHRIDSLLHILESKKDDTSKVTVLYKIGFECSVANFSKAKFYLKKAEQLARVLNYKKGIANSLSYLGIAYETQGNYVEALKAQMAALKLREEIDDKSGISYSLHYIGDIYFGQSDLIEKKISKDEYNKKALDQYFKALEIGKQASDAKSIANTYNCIGNSYREQEKYSKALEYYFNSVLIRKRINDRLNLSTTYVNIGKLYLKKGNFPEALTYLFQALNLSEKLGHKRTIVKALETIATIYFMQKDYSRSIDFSLRSLQLGRKIGYLEYIAKANKLMSQIYIAKDFNGHNGDKAFKYYWTYISERDSIDSKKANQLELQFDFDKKEELAKAEQNKKDAIASQELKHQEQQRNYLIIGLLLLAILTLFILRGYRQKQKANIIIAEKNREILDSITYALNIQQAKLPKKEEIYAVLPHSFVLFKPKDIVSGDFYYLHKKGNLIFIASADCTGHGVPGAFMSLIGSEKLDDAFAHSSDTSEILKLLNNGIKISLKQSDLDDSATRDGMDIALCCIDTDTRVVKYSGANRPLWIIRKGESLLQEIKATKKAIGGFTENNQHYDTHEIDFNEGDTFYIFTDGYTDQFNGEHGKKLMTKNFKEILVGIQNKNMNEQEKYLDDFIETWRSGSEQIDDILVIGVRF